MSTWNAWNVYQEVTEAFLSVLEDKLTALDADSAAFSVIERFVVVLYDKNSSSIKVNATRRELFTKKGDHWKVFHQRRCVLTTLLGYDV